MVRALFATILMAHPGTMEAALMALQLAFSAATNFAPFVAVCFSMRRVFDFTRGVDALIWTIALSHAFGPGLMTGALAILATTLAVSEKAFQKRWKILTPSRSRASLRPEPMCCNMGALG